MAERITKLHLDSIMKRINKAAGTPEDAYAKGKAQVGNYSLEKGPGGFAFVQIVGDMGGESSVVGGRHSAKTIFDIASGFLAGLEARGSKKGFEKNPAPVHLKKFEVGAYSVEGKVRGEMTPLLIARNKRFATVAGSALADELKQMLQVRKL